MLAGSRTPRTIVASIRIAVARPTPSCLKMIDERIAKIPKTATITIAALETVLAVDLMPWATASSVVMPRSNASRTRLRMNTW
jgi:hypothetical protein